MRAYYFGCISQAGHYFWSPGADGYSRGRLVNPDGMPWGHVDGTLTPRRTTAQGAAALHDYTVDKRPGSNSVFFFDAVLDFDAALAAAREHFGRVVERIGAITLATPSPSTTRREAR